MEIIPESHIERRRNAIFQSGGEFCEREITSAMSRNNRISNSEYPVARRDGKLQLDRVGNLRP